MENQKKLLVRVQLINWHYFENERIAINGSTLISGENTAGKSTILDAIQLVLTTNTRKFNVAANEKGNRNLKGYVRCKIGNIGETYLRKNTVPANVALEFYEEKSDRYFVIGVHMLSVDEESPVVTKWYVEECRLEAMSFMVEDRPALAEEFKVNGKKIRYIEQKNAARDRFKRRLGNLEDKFFDIIPKSLAFKPMDNVKEFINKFVLSEANVDIAPLRENIETLSELELLLQRCQSQLEAIERILKVSDQIEAKEHDISVNELLLAIANRDALIQEIEIQEKDVRMKRETVKSNEEQLRSWGEQLASLDNMIIAIQVSIKSNESNKLVEDAERRIEAIQSEISNNKSGEKKLKEQIKLVKEYLRALLKLEYRPITISELEILGSVEAIEEKNIIVDKLAVFQSKEVENLRKEQAMLLLEKDGLDQTISDLVKRQKVLEKKQLTYPKNTQLLKNAIEKEFIKRGIHTKVYILAELLEITDPKWVNAIEGYFHTQKFYLIVEPEYYDIALEVYEKNRKDIHTAGIINSKKIPLNEDLNHQSLAYVVRSENRYAKAYSNYVLGRVRRCEDVKDLENYSIAITPECMLYQGYVVHHLNPKHYQNPFIGQDAYRIQLINVKEEIEVQSKKRSEIREQLRVYADVFESGKRVKLELLQLYLNTPYKLKELEGQLVKAKSELKEASKDPTLIQLNMQLDSKNNEKGELIKQKEALEKSNSKLEAQIENIEIDVQQQKEKLKTDEVLLEQKVDTDGVSYQEAKEKYENNRKTKSAKLIASNFAPQRAQYLNEKEELLNGKDGLRSLQYQFNQDFTQDFLIGLEGLDDYREAEKKLKTVEMIRYEENLKKAKEDCEEIFKSDFLSKMKENIENARLEFKNLNKALDSIYYGEDSYHFKISFEKKKEGLYRMITSENNQEGFNLWTSAFEAEYKEEMAELFAKLMTKDDKGQKIVEEYTDYRSYLDYDIEIRKKDGSVQRFSDIYGEKSGSETQVPYYVAIAASFYQIYRYGNSVRIMLLDEAFDKMDDDRIQSMMDFFNGLGLQVIMATPPGKIEIIGEKVDTVLAAIRVGQSSIVEEYDF